MNNQDIKNFISKVGPALSDTIDCIVENLVKQGVSEDDARSIVMAMVISQAVQTIGVENVKSIAANVARQMPSSKPHRTQDSQQIRADILSPLESLASLKNKL